MMFSGIVILERNVERFLDLLSLLFDRRDVSRLLEFFGYRHLECRERHGDGRLAYSAGICETHYEITDRIIHHKFEALNPKFETSTKLKKLNSKWDSFVLWIFII